MSRQNYDELLPSIEAIEDADTKTPNMPIDRYLQEAADLEIWSVDDKEQLMSVGVSKKTFDELPRRTGALRYAQSVWNKDRYVREEAAQEWTQKSPDAIFFKDELEHTLRFAFRKRPDLLSKVQAIEEGYGNADLVQDLSDLAVLGRANLPLLKALGFDDSKLDASAILSAEMSILLATMNGERIDSNKSKRLRDKAYTYLKEVVDEIREAGKFVFWKDTVRVQGYSSNYRRNWS